ncbi:MAG: hypothetical protein ACO35F_07860, partial [Ilumatobacteraceae bacterium]
MEETSQEVLAEGGSSPMPCLPEYQGANVAGIIPAFLGGAPIPNWVPQIAAGASAVVLVVLDGLGWKQLAERQELTPNLSSLV